MVHPATKVTVIAEQLLEDAIIKLINESGATGYTTVKGRGKGQHGLHGGKGRTLVDAFSIVKIEFVMKDRDKAIEVAEKLSEKLFVQQSGIIYLSTVEILRPTRF
ncbi:P-II family nitrogen regulator [Hyphobacterium sp.]|uniref:P-II family nitrogen regulator n=1 Tax=Hyphobacterium sp. TaxID=2004662 RepID=UPI003BAD45F6